QNLPVTICMDRAGLVGNDGPTHHGVFDIAYLQTIPNLTLCAPRDGNELRSMMYHTAGHNMDGITAIRYPRDSVPRQIEDDVKPIEWGTWEWLTDKRDAVVLAVGSMVNTSLRAAEILAAEGYNVAVVNARFIKPLDESVLNDLLKDARFVFSIEEGQLRGGFGSSVASWLLDNDFAGKFKAIGIPDSFTPHGDRGQLLKHVGLDGESIARSIEETISSYAEAPKRPSKILQKLGLVRQGNGRKKGAEKTISLTGTDPEQ
ncbi:hypothetical protein GF377_08805, partial [candidate division GN15 bacterium]|nr:hypothetical protein [candidate division GN15 bacterium]